MQARDNANRSIVDVEVVDARAYDVVDDGTGRWRHAGLNDSNKIGFWYVINDREVVTLNKREKNKYRIKPQFAS